MTEAGNTRLDLRALLAAVEAAAPVEAVDVLAAELAKMLDATHVSLLLANFSGSGLVRMSHVSAGPSPRDGSTEETESVPLAGSVHEQVLATQQVHVERLDAGWLVLVPVTERGDAMGLLELSTPYSPDEETIDYLTAAAHALAYVITAARRHTDLFETAQRDVPFSLAAEIQRRLLPSAYTVEGSGFTLAGWLEPANDVGGDTFDYSIDRDYLYASITDAMGHSDEAALLATFVVGSLRNRRRATASPAEQAAAANEALLGRDRPEQFVTGHLLRIRLADGLMEIVNAGHPVPFLLRDGRAAEVPLPAAPPLGVATGEYESHTVQLVPGDRLLLLTDGFLERNAVGIGVTETLETCVDRHPREVVREFADNVLKATNRNLRDDATVLCIDWYGADEARDAVGGASRGRATNG